jgi:hypothetical protein
MCCGTAQNYSATNDLPHRAVGRGCSTLGINKLALAEPPSEVHCQGNGVQAGNQSMLKHTFKLGAASTFT